MLFLFKFENTTHKSLTSATIESSMYIQRSYASLNRMDENLASFLFLVLAKEEKSFYIGTVNGLKAQKVRIQHQKLSRCRWQKGGLIHQLRRCSVDIPIYSFLIVLQLLRKIINRGKRTPSSTKPFLLPLLKPVEAIHIRGHQMTNRLIAGEEHRNLGLLAGGVSGSFCRVHAGRVLARGSDDQRHAGFLNKLLYILSLEVQMSAHYLASPQARPCK